MICTPTPRTPALDWTEHNRPRWRATTDRDAFEIIDKGATAAGYRYRVNHYARPDGRDHEIGARPDLGAAKRLADGWHAHLTRRRAPSSNPQ